MSPRPLVTIVTPSLNQGRFIGEAIRSVAAQTYDQVEHLVVDGGSTDGTLDVLSRAELDDGLRWVSEPDRGMYEAINKGVRQARGDVLAYLNGDDAYLPWAVETAVAVFETRPDVSLVYGDGLRVDVATGKQRLRLFPPFDRPSLANLGSLMQPTVFWRSSLGGLIGTFDDELRYVGDLDYWLRASAVGTAAHVDEVLALERTHPGSLSESQAVAMATEDRIMRRRHGADAETLEGRVEMARAIRRYKIWQRRLWLRFLAASRSRNDSGPWGRFLSHGQLTISPARILLGQLPRSGDRFLPNSVRSQLAMDIFEEGD